MPHLVSFATATAIPIAAVRASTRWPEVPGTIRSCLDGVWAHLRAHPAGAGRNVVVYLGDAPGVEVGVEISAALAPSARVLPSATPAGPVAHTRHVGTYRQLGAAHQAVLRACRDAGRCVTGTRWEIYGHWTDREDLLETDVYYLLSR